MMYTKSYRYKDGLPFTPWRFDGRWEADCIVTEGFLSRRKRKMFFDKAKADQAQMPQFWQWFQENEEWIIENISGGKNASQVINAIDEKLFPIFCAYKKELEFMLGYNNGKGEFIFYDLHKKSMRKDGETLGSLMPEELRKRWTFSVEH